ncbi:MAG: YggT family protein [Chloroflexota bacterium]
MTDYQRTTTRETDVGAAPAPGYETTTTRTDVAPAPAVANDTVRTTESSYTPAGPSGATLAARIVTFAFGVLQALLILRIILLLLVANPNNGIVDTIFNITQPFVEPFIGMFSLNRVQADQGSVLDIAAIVALIGWTLIEALILAALRIFSRRPAEAV